VITQISEIMKQTYRTI